MLGPRYHVLELLGEGAMGQVFLAMHKELGRKEAVKVLKPQVASDPSLVARFRREARATNRLHHPNIVAMHDFGQLPDGRLYLAMEYVDGVPLQKLIADDGPMPATRVVHLLCQLAAAVEHAHSRGVVHRDLKPANLMLVQHRSRADVLKILDFGVAKIISPEYSESVMVSHQGLVFGTPLYMAPEQYQEGSYDPRSDIYAIGCIACELLTGRPPFVGSVREVIFAHAEHPAPRPSDFSPDVPRGLDDIVAQCLAKEPAERYQTAGELLNALVTQHPRHFHAAATRESVDGAPVPNLARYDLYESLSTMANTLVRSMGEPTGWAQGAAAASPMESDSAALAEERKRAWEHAVRELAERLVDHGAGDVLLTVTVAEVREAEHQLGHCEAERRALDEHEMRVEEGAREREGMLRFALGELTFERDRGSTDPTLEYQINELGKRLTEVRAKSETELAALADRAIELAARRDEIEEHRQELIRRLARLVDDLVPAFDSDLALAPFIDRYQALAGLE